MGRWVFGSVHAYSMVVVTLASGCMGLWVDESMDGWVCGWMGLRVGEWLIDMKNVGA